MSRLLKDLGDTVQTQELLDRLAGYKARDHKIAQEAIVHLTALENRIAQAAQSVHLGHLGSARSFLELGREEYDAALKVLPRP